MRARRRAFSPERGVWLYNYRQSFEPTKSSVIDQRTINATTRVQLASPPSSPSSPRAAAVVVLLRAADAEGAVITPAVFWAKRGERLNYLAGFHAFPGGAREQTDAAVAVENCGEAERAAMIACAARELFEETGVLLARGGERLTAGQRASLHDDLLSGRMSFPRLLEHYGLHLDAEDFTFVGRWVTPPFGARRFDTWFFLARCPPKQRPQAIDGELQCGEWIDPAAALARWSEGEALLAPPVLHALRTLEAIGAAGGVSAAPTDRDSVVEKFLSVTGARGEVSRSVEFVPGFVCLPLHTPTLPPATHTNCYVVGAGRELVVVDPGSPYDAEQRALGAYLDEVRERRGARVREIVLTHYHEDHVGGVAALLERLGGEVAIAAHRATAARLEGRDDFRVTRLIEDGDELTFDGEPPLSLRALHTPGHARGHLCFYERRRAVLLAGDVIVGAGTVLIDPPEGDMSDYVTTLRNLRALPELRVILGGHGPAIGNPRIKIDEYIEHRLAREAQILAAVNSEPATAAQIARRVYADAPDHARSLAERATLAHLGKLEKEQIIRRSSVDDLEIFSAA